MTDEGKACVVVLVTCKDYEQAKKISEALLEHRQAACVNIIPEIQSFFRWQGRVDQAQEVLLVIKTQAVLFDAIRKTVKEIHSYQTPEIVAVPLVDGDRDYLDWIKIETQQKDK